MRLRRGFDVRTGERCLVVEDVITTGGSTREVITVVEEAGGTLTGVGTLIDRSGGAAAFPARKVALATLSVPTYRPEDCPLCKAGLPAVKPGSRPARQGVHA
jgi:orotate phosphoribosyltransferase